MANVNPIQPIHLGKFACIYIRQSSMEQVRENTASTEVQRDLVERAVALGWPRDRVRIYDSDLGVSSCISSTREGFREFAADVGMGNVGIVLSFDVTRFARNNVDWHRLLELCSICGTLMGDCDGIYDLMQYNDRLLLGLKGTLSEAEGSFPPYADE
ncbi:MAG: recombinase family protein [Myxococcales bacterium]